MKARREALERVDRSATTHAGLWLDRYLSVQNDQRNPGSTEGVGEKAYHFRSVESTAVPRGYVEAYDRWRQSLPADHTALVIDIQAEHRRFDYAPGWMAAEGWGADPLASRE